MGEVKKIALKEVDEDTLVVCRGVEENNKFLKIAHKLGYPFKNSNNGHFIRSESYSNPPFLEVFYDFSNCKTYDYTQFKEMDKKSIRDFILYLHNPELERLADNEPTEEMPQIKLHDILEVLKTLEVIDSRPGDVAEKIEELKLKYLNLL